MNRQKLVKYLIDSSFTETELDSILKKFEFECIKRGAKGQHDCEVKFRKVLASKKQQMNDKFFKEVLSDINDKIYAKKQENEEASRRKIRNERRRAKQ